MAFKKGHVKTGGRTKGSKNTIAVDVRRMMYEALEKAGGTEYLTDQANKNPKAFLALLGRTLPTEIKAVIEQKTNVVHINMIGLEPDPLIIEDQTLSDNTKYIEQEQAELLPD